MDHDLIKKMARTEKLKLQEAFEKNWKTGAFPKEWTKTILIPILKLDISRAYDTC
jgi:hypothetical protein